MVLFFFFNDTATTEIYTLSLHDALPILLLLEGIEAAVGIALGDGRGGVTGAQVLQRLEQGVGGGEALGGLATQAAVHHRRSEEHTSELQSRQYLVCRLLLEKKKIIQQAH